jgi:RimJ/RimL family protein N-acetyltransferase
MAKATLDRVTDEYALAAEVNDEILPGVMAWQAGLATIRSPHVTLRELRASDAPSLLTLLSTREVACFISPPPSSLEGFERFIAWTHEQRAAGQFICFGVVPRGMDVAVGTFQLRRLDATFKTAEWGFALGSPFWGSGLFVESAQLVLRFAFDTLGVHRLEARAAIANGRGCAALRKVGAVQEGVLRRAFLRDDRYFDQTLWTIVDEDWRESLPTPA